MDYSLDLPLPEEFECPGNGGQSVMSIGQNAYLHRRSPGTE